MTDPAPTASAVEPGDEPADETGAAHQSPRSRLQQLLGFVVVFVIAVLATTPFVVHNIHTFRAVNPVDEASYIDYLNKVDHGHFIVGEGENDDAAVDHAVQCRGLGTSFIGFTTYQVPPNPAACAGAPHKAFSIRDGADIDPPTYYVLTDIGVKILRGAGVTDDIVQAGRLTGIFWGALSLTLMFFLSRLLGARRWPAALVCAAALLTSQIDDYWSFISPHGTDIAVGAAAAIITLQWRRRKLPTWTLFLAGGVTVAIEGSDLISGLLLILFTLVSAYLVVTQKDGEAAERRSEVLRLLVGAVVIAAGIVIVSLGWLAIRKHYALTSVPAFQAQFYTPHFQLHYLFDAVGSFAVPYQLTAGYVVTFWVLGSVVLYATRSGGRTAHDGQRQALAVALIPIVAFGACVFVITDYLTEHQYHGVYNRYALSLVPIMYAYAALNLRSRWAQAATLLLIAILGYLIANPAA